MDEPMESSVESTTGEGDGGVLSSSTDALRSEADPAMRSSRSQSEPIVTSSVNVTEENSEDLGDTSKPQTRFSPLLRPGSMGRYPPVQK